MDEATLKKRVDDIFSRLDMNGFRERRCDKLSTGMKQKTSIARTLVHDPPVMIFDEPTLGLDIMTARTITTFIRECRDRGKTVIFSTHITADPVRTRKLLLHHSELQRLIGAVERRGYTLVPLELYWKNGRAKLQLALAKGKKQHDKRAVEKDRDWQRDKARLLRRG